MTVEEKVQAVLVAAAGVTALVPAAKIKVWYEPDRQNLDPPYILHLPVAVEPTQLHSGPAALRQWRYYQVSVFAATHSAAAAIREAVIAALDGYHDAGVDRIAWRGLGSGDSSTDQKIEHLALNFEVAEGLSGS